MTESMWLRILIAEREHARPLRPDEDNGLRIANNFGSATAHLLVRERVSDHPRRAFENARPRSHGIAPRHDTRQMERRGLSISSRTGSVMRRPPTRSTGF